MFRLFSQSVSNDGVWRSLSALQSFNPATPEDSSTAIFGYGLERKLSCGTGNIPWHNRMAWLGQKTNAADGSTVHSIGATWICYDNINNRQRYSYVVHEVAVKRTVPTTSRPPSLQGRPSGQPTRQPTHLPSQRLSSSWSPTSIGWRALKSDERQDVSKGKGGSKSQGQSQGKSTSNDKGDAAADASPKKRPAASTSTTSAAAAKRVNTAA